MFTSRHWRVTIKRAACPEEGCGGSSNRARRCDPKFDARVCAPERTVWNQYSTVLHCTCVTEYSFLFRAPSRVGLERQNLPKGFAPRVDTLVAREQWYVFTLYYSCSLGTEEG